MSTIIQSGKSLKDLTDSKKYYYILDNQRKTIKCNEPAFLSWHSNLPKLIKTRHGRRILLTRNPKWFVSTVFLGHAHGFDGDKPIIWETLKITEDGVDFQRYSCYNDAMRGHNSVIAEMRQVYE